MLGRIVVSLVVAVVTYVVILIIAALLATIGADAIAAILRGFGWILAIAAGVYYYYTHRV